MFVLVRCFPGHAQKSFTTFKMCCFPDVCFFKTCWKLVRSPDFLLEADWTLCLPASSSSVHQWISNAVPMPASMVELVVAVLNQDLGMHLSKLKRSGKHSVQNAVTGNNMRATPAELVQARHILTSAVSMSKKRHDQILG